MRLLCSRDHLQQQNQPISSVEFADRQGTKGPYAMG